MVAAVIFSNTYWTFWDVFLLFFLFIPLVMLWFFCIFDVFTRRDLSGWGKAAWLVGILVLPWIGTLAYMIFRPSDQYAGASAYGGDPRQANIPAQYPPASQIPPKAKAPTR